MTCAYKFTKNINLNQARYLALTGDTVGALDEMLKQVGSYKEISEQLPMVREKEAAAIGMTGDQLLKALKYQEALVGLSGTQIKEVSELSRQQILARQGVIANMSQEQQDTILAQHAQIKASELTASAMAKMSLMADAFIAKEVGGDKAKAAYENANLTNEFDGKPDVHTGDSYANGGGPLSMSMGESGVSVKDALIRPGQAPITFDKNDIILAGTDLMGDTSSSNNNGTGNSEVVELLKQLIKLVDQPVYFNIGGRVIDELDSRITMRKSYNSKMDSGYGANG